MYLIVNESAQALEIWQTETLPENFEEDMKWTMRIFIYAGGEFCERDLTGKYVSVEGPSNED